MKLAARRGVRRPRTSPKDHPGAKIPRLPQHSETKAKAMKWYAAHIVLYVHIPEGQERFPVWENVVLIRAATEQQAFAKAETLGQSEQGDDDGSFRWGTRPARWVFAGVRKL